MDPEEMPELDGELEAAATNVDKSLARYRGLVSDARDRALYEKTAPPGGPTSPRSTASPTPPTS